MFAIAPLRFVLLVEGLRRLGERQRLRRRQLPLGLGSALGRERVDAVLDLLPQQAGPLARLRKSKGVEPAEAEHVLFRFGCPLPSRRVFSYLNTHDLEPPSPTCR